MAKKEYIKSDSVLKAEEALKNHQMQKPGAYQSGFKQQLDETMDKILNREQFKYDLGSDAMYQSLKDQAIAGGKKAMMDTMGRAATMTGGYGNSYAQLAGQQAYQSELQKLGGRIPELYNLALQRYGLEGQELRDRYGMLADKESKEYGRYQDAMNRYQQEQNRLQSIYESERGFDYGKYRDDLNYAQAQEQFQYQQMLDKLAQERWQKEFDENNRRYEESRSRGGGGGGSGGGSSGGSSGGKSSQDFASAMSRTRNPADAKRLVGEMVESGVPEDVAMELYYKKFGRYNTGSNNPNPIRKPSVRKEMVDFK